MRRAVLVGTGELFHHSHHRRINYCGRLFVQKAFASSDSRNDLAVPTRSDCRLAPVANLDCAIGKSGLGSATILSSESAGIERSIEYCVGGTNQPVENPLLFDTLYCYWPDDRDALSMPPLRRQA